MERERAKKGKEKGEVRRWTSPIFETWLRIWTTLGVENMQNQETLHYVPPVP